MIGKLVLIFLKIRIIKNFKYCIYFRIIKNFIYYIYFRIIINYKNYKYFIYYIYFRIIKYFIYYIYIYFIYFRNIKYFNKFKYFRNILKILKNFNKIYLQFHKRHSQEDLNYWNFLYDLNTTGWRNWTIYK
jgi:hypothetical protein